MCVCVCVCVCVNFFFFCVELKREKSKYVKTNSSTKINILSKINYLVLTCVSMFLLSSENFLKLFVIHHSSKEYIGQRMKQREKTRWRREVMTNRAREKKTI